MTSDKPKKVKEQSEFKEIIRQFLRVFYNYAIIQQYIHQEPGQFTPDSHFIVRFDFEFIRSGIKGTDNCGKWIFCFEGNVYCVVFSEIYRYNCARNVNYLV